MPRLSITVSIPPDPGRQKVVVVGTDRGLGDWQPEKGLDLQCESDGRFTGAIDVPYGLIEFKITGGSWESEEVALDGATLPNRQYLIAHDLSLYLEVEHWRDATPWDDELVDGKAIECELDATMLHESRRVCVWLPPGYMQSGDSQHPVLYLLNGQECLDATAAPGQQTVRADLAVRRLARTKLIPELIIVAAFHGEDRLETEISPQCDGPKFADFLVHDVKPFIDYTFCRDRVLKDPGNTAALGFSLGGSLALFMAMRHANTFGKFACLSPNYADLSADLPDNCWIIDQVRTEPGLRPDRKIYFDHGTLGADTNAELYQEPISALLRGRGFVEGRDFKVLKAEGTEPELSAWRARLGAPLQFLFG